MSTSRVRKRKVSCASCCEELAQALVRHVAREQLLQRLPVALAQRGARAGRAAGPAEAGREVLEALARALGEGGDPGERGPGHRQQQRLLHRAARELLQPRPLLLRQREDAGLHDRAQGEEVLVRATGRPALISFSREARRTRSASGTGAQTCW